MLFKGTALLLLILSAAARVFPPAVTEQYSEGHLTLGNACNLFHFPSDHHLIKTGYYFNKILKRLNGNFECSRPLMFIQEQHVRLQVSPINGLKPQAYEIIVNQNGIQINYGDYSGYVYALETLSQIVKDGKIPFATIKDQPLLQYRGIMIDSSRHYLGVASIHRLIESMPISKLNILHWHLVDDESFPIQLSSHPELSEGGSYSSKEIYTIKQIQDLISAAALNGVQIVPQIDTPAHVRSWGVSNQWLAKNISIKCNGGTGYNGQFDLSKPEVFDLVKDVVLEVNKLFASSPYIHLGGDEVFSSCWNLRPAIQTFMQQKGIKTYGELQMYWRKQIKSVLPPNRKVIYWRNDGQDVTTLDNDVLHFWGSQADVAKITANTTSQIILSPSDMLYISKGQGNLWLNGTQGIYTVWKNIYDNFTVFPAGVDPARILGAEVCLWGEVSNEDTMENNIWMRASAFAARVWSSTILQTYEIVASLVQTQYVLYDMNVDASPITSEFCEHYPKICFPPPAEKLAQGQKPVLIEI